ncbi:carbohydrate porin [Swaminathania salitolerans]|uniref:Porin n=1 Tax=Swaminathania salitolerans TaxID=182838 RepID=A0A511BS02_9PROT|nr:carbohydrate porin [Swaminathania salitolerans]GBQ14037.1 carbohydrate-selective porin B [Swaminathania salitolerans LMG 21291]GEL02892.1 porin [Swaminathania salitolerans]
MSLTVLRRLVLCLALTFFSGHARAEGDLPAPTKPGEIGAIRTGTFPAVEAQAARPVLKADTTVAPLPRPEAIFTDPHGVNSWLRERGIAFLLDNTNEMAGMIHAPTRGLGLRKGASNAGQYSVESDIDWERLADWRGFATHAVIVGRYGIPVSRMFGDNLNPSQEIYGAGGNVFVHLVFAYGEETLFNDRFDVAAGRMSFLSDFSANPLYCNFMNNAFCGNPKASSDNTAHASYPDSNWAIRFRLRPSETTIFQFGVYFTQTQGIYGNTQMRTGFKFNGADIDGQAMPVEFIWSPRLGHDHELPGHYKLGFVYDTADHKDNYYDGNGNPFALSGLAPRDVHGAWAAWGLIDQMVYHHPGQAADAGLTFLGVAYVNQPETQTRADQLSIGLLDRGFWKARPLDGLGLNFSWTHVSDALTRSQRLYAMQGRPLPNGSLFPQTSTYNLELLYQIHVMRGVTFAPDFQYYFNPGAQKQLNNQAVIGFKSHIEIF